MGMVERIARTLAAIHWRQNLTHADRKALGPVDSYVNDAWRTHVQGARDILATMRLAEDGMLHAFIDKALAE